MNIKTPPMPNFPENSVGDVFLMACQDRDQQWIEMVRPVVVALSVILNNNESLVFEREARDALAQILSQIKGE